MSPKRREWLVYDFPRVLWVCTDTPPHLKLSLGAQGNIQLEWYLVKFLGKKGSGTVLSTYLYWPILLKSEHEVQVSVLSNWSANAAV